MACHVVDTGVLIVANGRSEQAPAACVAQCIGELQMIRSEVLVLDRAGEILREYFGRVSRSGQPGLGDMLAKWAYDNQANPAVVRAVDLHADDDWGFAEFPHDPDLATFDRSDRKFVAAACAAGPGTRLVSAVDSDYTNAYDALSRHIAVYIPAGCPQPS